MSTFEGLKTLALRIKQQNQNAALLADYLQKHSKVTKVNSRSERRKN
jgi:cystathionine beta-lyase/cystathionine gamma-synthase